MNNICKSCRSSAGRFKDHHNEERNLCSRDKADGVMHHVPYPLGSCPYYRKVENKPKELKED